MALHCTGSHQIRSDLFHSLSLAFAVELTFSCFVTKLFQVLNIYELSPLEEDFVLGERGDRVGKVPRCNNTLTIKIIAVIFL